MQSKNISRRKFIRNSGLITIGFSMAGACQLNGMEDLSREQSLPSSLSRFPKIDSWLHVLENGQIRIFTGKIELGQGIRIAVAQVAAEELNSDPASVEVHLAETDITPNEGYTAGSRSIEASAMSIRYAAAAARKILINRASQKMNESPDNLVVADGLVKNKAGNKQFNFFKILDGEQIKEDVTTPVELKPKNEYKWVGKPVHRKDLPDMVKGTHQYVQDLRFPDMVHARIIRPPGYKARLQEYDESALKKNVSGILKLVVNGSFLGIITEKEHQAENARLYMKNNTRWSKSEKLPSTKNMKEYIKNLSSEHVEVEDRGTTNFGDKSIRASYSKPYIMHGSIGPSCAVGYYDNDKLHIWSHTQGVYPLRESLKELVGLPEEKIRITGIPGSGCYGHNGADDVAADVALLSLSYPGRHVRLQWSRADENGWEPFGSAMVMELEAELDNAGKISSWRYDLWSDTHSTRPGGNPGNLLPSRYVKDPTMLESRGYLGGGYRNAEPFYRIPNLKIDGHFFKGPLRVSALRGLGAYANIFAIESFMDELAERAGRDPLDFRLAHLDDPRAVEVINTVRRMTSGEQTGDREGIGFAFSKYKNQASYCAVAAKVKMDDKGKPVITMMWAAIDSGEIINPDGLRNQTEGGMIQSASWTMSEEVKFDEEHVTSLNWYSYPVFRYQDVPEVKVELIDRPGEPPLGAGEAAQGPASAAIVNAIYRASGERIRDLPVRSALA